MDSIKSTSNKDWSKRNGSGSYLLRVFNSIVYTGKRDEKEHHHLEIEFSFIKRGRGIFLVGEETVELKEGDLFVFDVNESHCILEITEETEIFKIWFSPQYVWTFDLLDNRHINIFSGSSPLKPKVEEGELKDYLTSAMKRMEAELSVSARGFERKMTLIWLDMLVEIERRLGGKTPVKHANDYERMEKIIEYIERNYCEELTLETLASVANLSRTYFCSYFKECNNVTVWEYVTLKRVNRAVRLLRSTDRTVLDIAVSCGFNNSTNFIRAFKKTTGKTPSFFRKQKQENRPF